VHGSASALKAVLNKLGPNDRLFIVGDLTDRGEDSAKVMRLVMENQHHVFVTRGNHEQIFIDAMNAIAKLRDPTGNAPISDHEKGIIRTFLHEGYAGGLWVFPNTLSHSRSVTALAGTQSTSTFSNDERKLLQKMKGATSTTPYSRHEINFFDTLFVKLAQSIDEQKFTELCKIRDYMDTLPLTTVRGGDDSNPGDTSDPEALIVCHASMPLSDTALKTKNSLDDTEKKTHALGT
jgi:hypothetical protein